MPAPTRPPSLIALRARREALHIAREVAYPELKVQQTWTLPVLDPEPEASRRPYYYVAPMVFVDDPPEPAPSWMKGLAIGGSLIIGGAALTILCAH
jgi:hypothetical protein